MKNEIEKALATLEEYFIRETDRIRDMVNKQIKSKDLFSIITYSEVCKELKEKEETYYQFAHEVDLDYNDMFKYTNEIFENPASIHEVSKKDLLAAFGLMDAGIVRQVVGHRLIPMQQVAGAKWGVHHLHRRHVATLRR